MKPLINLHESVKPVSVDETSLETEEDMITPTIEQLSILDQKVNLLHMGTWLNIQWLMQQEGYNIGPNSQFVTH